jgi:hypothetical protein
MLHWDAKKPAAVDDYDLDWSRRLATGETITSSAWLVLGTISALLASSGTFLPTRTKTILSAGTDKQTYILKNTVVTSLGNTLYEYVSIMVRE